MSKLINGSFSGTLEYYKNRFPSSFKRAYSALNESLGGVLGKRSSDFIRKVKEGLDSVDFKKADMRAIGKFLSLDRQQQTLLNSLNSDTELEFKSLKLESSYPLSYSGELLMNGDPYGRRFDFKFIQDTYFHPESSRFEILGYYEGEPTLSVKAPMIKDSTLQKLYRKINSITN